MKFLKKVQNLPTELEEGVLYYNETDGAVTLKKAEPTPVDPYAKYLVDLGLPSGLQWMSMNVGATSPEEYGKYFQWGDTVGYEGDEAKAHSDWETAPFNNGSSDYDSTYFSTISGTVCPNGVLASVYDAATKAYGEGYYMSTKTDYDELLANTTSAYTKVNGVNCLKLTSKSDASKSIVFPAAGRCDYGSFSRVGSYGSVLTSSLRLDNPNDAWFLYFGSGDMYMGSRNRCSGFTVRAVKPKQS